MNWLGDYMEKIIEIEGKKYFVDTEKLTIKLLETKCCKKCGNKFIYPGRKDTAYCDNCRDTGAMDMYLEKISNDTIMKEFNKAYKRNHARVRYKKMSKEDFHKWSLKAREMREKANSGEVTIDEFVSYLSR